MKKFCARSGSCLAILAGLAPVAAFAASDKAVGQAHAAAVGSGHVLQLVTGDVDIASLPDLLVEQPAVFEVGKAYVLMTDGPLAPANRAALEALGVQLHDYLPENAFIADLSNASPAALAASRLAVWAGEYQDGWKIDPAIGNRPYFTDERVALAAQGYVALDVTLFETADVDATLADLAAFDGATITRIEEIGGNQTATVVFPAQSVADLAAMSGVQFVEEVGDYQQRNLTERWIVQSNVTNVTPLYSHGLHGENQVLGHMDGQIDVNHCSLKDDGVDPPGPSHRKIVANHDTSGAVDDHGTHTACIGMGDNNIEDNNRGHAYLAKIVHNSIPSFTESAINTRLTTHHNEGARTHTNSWGDDGTTSYNGLCRGIDSFSRSFEDSLVFFAETNLSALKNPENAKNLVAVGNCGLSGSQGTVCSGGAGPTADGRRKPDLFAPGCNTQSANGLTTCSTQALLGTSMASPAAAGEGLLVRQYFTTGVYPHAAAFTPSGALIKAVVMNGTVDMTGVSGYPSNGEGWGRMLLDNVLEFAGDARKLLVTDVRNASGLATGGMTEYQFDVNSTSQQLRVTLVFTDQPGTSGASNPVINDLNLEVVNPSSSVYLGNNLSGGVSITGGTADGKNNVEMVILNSPPVGTWTARVKGTNVPTGPQGYAVVITGDVVDVAAPPCVGDIDGNGGRDLGDLGVILASYSACIGDGNYNAAADLDANGCIDLSDLGTLLAVFGQLCP